VNKVLIRRSRYIHIMVGKAHIDSLQTIFTKRDILLFLKLPFFGQIKIFIRCDLSSINEFRFSRASLYSLLLLLRSGTAQGNSCLRRINSKTNAYLITSF
jgi:hypothetical protein